ncbi:MAG TPA: DUF6265 family protein [Gemmatimonadaceae bacterium]|jgi:hypothetical protein
MSRAIRWCALILVLASPHAEAQHKSGPVERLTWIAGCWRQTTGNRVVDEQWMAPRGGMMLGMSRTVRNDTTIVEFEQLRITDRGAGAVYHAEPSGQAAADFVAATVGDSMVTFSNPQHDFPQRIIYRRHGADSLIARIEGTRGGSVHGVDFPYVRATCPK